MIAFVRGRVADVGLASAVVEVGAGGGGIGLEVMCTPGTLASLRAGQEAELPTSMVVREDSMTLFGFADTDEKQCFELLQTASGVGPEAGAGDARRAQPRRPAGGRGRRRRQDADQGARDRPEGRAADHPRARATGWAPRSAAGRVAGPGRASTAAARGAGWRDQVQQGLVGLGWSAKEADKAIERVADRAGEAPDVAALLRAALRTLSRA